MSTKVSINTASIRCVLATDCGSTTTKAVLFEKTKNGWRQTYRGEAPTTVEKPVADVTIGARNSFAEVGEISGRRILSDDSEGDSPFLMRTDEDSENGIDLYVSTSSAGGGLQMIVAGLVAEMSTASAERAALGAGAIVMDAISLDDGREQYERVQKIRHLRPDIVLLAGGTDDGAKSLPLELAETILQADPRPRFGETLRLPVIYAGNAAISDEVQKILESRFAFNHVENLRPVLEEENLAPARDEVHELFLSHVMSHAPGYKKLLGYSPVPILPTPAAVGEMVRQAAREDSLQIIAVDIGGATTDVFSVFNSKEESPQPVFNRTVSANLGMSYSVANVLLEAGEAAIRRWLPFEISPSELRDRLRNKMIRPTSIPQTVEDLVLEQAVCREALRLAFFHHKRLAVGLKGQAGGSGLTRLFATSDNSELVDMYGLDLIIGSGGVLSHAPNRLSTVLMLIDAYEPRGITELAVDSIFMMPHLGVLSTVLPEAAKEIFNRDCLVKLGAVVAPVGEAPANGELAKVRISGEGREYSIESGKISRVEMPEDSEIELEVIPDRRVNLGAGRGQTVTKTISTGSFGLFLDGRGRDILFPEDKEERLSSVQSWYRALKVEFS